MSEKVEWEIVDDAPRAQSAFRESAAWQAEQDAGMPRHPLELILGPWWRWKLAGMALVVVCMLVLLALFAGVFVLLAAAGVLLSLAAAKARKLFGRPGGPISPR